MFIAFDLDGTLADDTQRQHYLHSFLADQEAYYQACDDDLPISVMARLFRSLMEANPSHHIEIWTGRPERVRFKTERWLQENDLYWNRKRIGHHCKVRMRQDGDHRDVTKVMGEWLAEVRGSDDNLMNEVDLAFDNRTTSVKWWRSEGITCLQNADHDYLTCPT